MKVYVFFCVILISHIRICAQTFPTEKAIDYDNQVLYNGRQWKDIHNLVRGNQFLFSDSLLPGTVFIIGKEFRNVFLKYDIFNDVILTPLFAGGFLQLNREMIDSFYLSFENRVYRFIRLPDSHTDGYFNLLYKGKTILVTKYSKYIKKRAVDDTFDKFLEERKMYLFADDNIFEIRGIRGILKVFPGKRELIKNYLKNNDIRKSNEFESYIPVLRYIDGL